MNTNDLNRERISALADGELEDAQMEAAFALLHSEDARADWQLYHQIGDVLRSEDMAEPLSRDFSSRLAERLEREPVYIAPGVRMRESRRAWHLVAGAAAVATVAFVATPPLIDLLQPEPAVPEMAVAVPAENAIVLTSTPEGMILRDPRIDDYLFAHQRFSPSMHYNAQYTRNANFPGK